MKNKRTPGPWTVDKHQANYVMQGKDVVAKVTIPDDSRLVAAAPEMLDALKRVECQLGLCGNAISTGDDFHKLIKRTIAKAEEQE